MNISIIIPALNEQEGITSTITSIPKKKLETLGHKVQIIVADNGSMDDTRELARRTGADVVTELRKGYGHAIKIGIANSDGDIIITADGDATYPMYSITRIVKLLEKKSLDFINTNRLYSWNDESMSTYHKFGNYFISFITRILFGIKLKDSQSGMVAFRKSLLDKLILNSNSFAFCEELKIEACYYAKCKWEETPIAYYPRLGKSKLGGTKTAITNVLFLFKKRIMR